MSQVPNVNQLPKQQSAQRNLASKLKTMGKVLHPTGVALSQQNSRIAGVGTNSVYLTKQTRSFSQYKQKLNALNAKVTVSGDQTMKAGEDFDCTLRNTKNPYHSSPYSQKAFNNQYYTKLKLQSRFIPDQQHSSRTLAQIAPALTDNHFENMQTRNNDEILFDIQGNSFKSTLIPPETYAHELDINREMKAIKQMSGTALGLHKATKSVLPHLNNTMQEFDSARYEEKGTTSVKIDKKLIREDTYISHYSRGRFKSQRKPFVLANDTRARPVLSNLNTNKNFNSTVQSPSSKGMLDEHLQDRLQSKLNEGLASLDVEDMILSKQKIVPQKNKFQGYQRSGALFFNNVNSANCDAENVNQTATTQTFNQVRRDSTYQSKTFTHETDHVQQALNLSVDLSKDLSTTSLKINRQTSNDAHQHAKQQSPYDTWKRNIHLKEGDKYGSTGKECRYFNNPTSMTQHEALKLASEHGRKPVKMSEELNKNISVLSKYSQPFFKRNYNDYDNQKKQGDEKLFNKLGIKAKNMGGFKRMASPDISLQSSTIFDNGLQKSNGWNKLNTSVENSWENSPMHSQEKTRVVDLAGQTLQSQTSKGEVKKEVYQNLNKWNYFDSNMNNNLIEQRKLIRSKNYELDSRANALKEFGYQPFVALDMAKKRAIDDVVLGQKVVSNAQDHLTPFRHNYTSITKFQKSLINSKMCSPDNTGQKHQNLRPNLNMK